MIEKVFEVSYKNSLYTIHREELDNDRRYVYYNLTINHSLQHKHRISPFKEESLNKEIMNTFRGYLKHLKAKQLAESSDARDVFGIIQSLKQ